MGIKNAESDADFEFVEKCCRKLMRKSYHREVTEKWTFLTFITVCNSFLPISLLCIL
jgi:hypothetical protein